MSNVKQPNITPRYSLEGKRLYDKLINSGNLFMRLGRLKYKGDGMSQTELNELNKYLTVLGWKFYKDANKEPGEKYVWVKS